MHLRFLVCTWNVGNAVPQLDDLAKWLMVDESPDAMPATPIETHLGRDTRSMSRGVSQRSPPRRSVAADTDKQFDVVVVGAQETKGAADAIPRANTVDASFDPMASGANFDIADSETDETSSDRFECESDFFAEDEVNSETFENFDKTSVEEDIPYHLFDDEGASICDDEDPETSPSRSPAIPTRDFSLLGRMTQFAGSPRRDSPPQKSSPNIPSSPNPMRRSGRRRHLDKWRKKLKLWTPLSRGSAVTVNNVPIEDRNDRARRDEIALERAAAEGDSPVAVPMTFQRNTTASPTFSDSTSDSEEDIDQGADPMARATSHKPTKQWYQLLGQVLGDDFVHVEQASMMQLRVSVFVRRRVQHLVHSKIRGSVGTGVANVVGNKGAVAIFLRIGCLSFCFISAHLAAHEGTKYLKERNKDFWSILRTFQHSGRVPITHKYDHVFWMGDCNYRIDPTITNEEARNWSFQEKWQHVSSWIEKGMYEELVADDELRAEQSRGSVFVGFRECRIDFPPTFKVRRTAELEYNTERIPSYCDRILWTSRPLVSNHVTPIRYASVPSASTSDHKPVHACFVIFIPPPFVRPLQPDMDGLRATIVLTNVRLRLPQRSTNSRNETTSGAGRRQLEIIGQGLFLTKKSFVFPAPGVSETPIVRFEDASLCPIPCVCVANIDHLRGRYLNFVTYRDLSKKSASALLPFERLIGNGNRQRRFRLVMSSYGRPAGMFEADIALIVNAGATWRADGDRGILHKNHFAKGSRSGSPLPGISPKRPNLSGIPKR